MGPDAGAGVGLALGCLGWPCRVTAYLATFGVQQQEVTAPASSLRGPRCVHLVSALPGHGSRVSMAPEAHGSFWLPSPASGCSLQGLLPTVAANRAFGGCLRGRHLGPATRIFLAHSLSNTVWLSALQLQEADFPGAGHVLPLILLILVVT